MCFGVWHMLRSGPRLSLYALSYRVAGMCKSVKGTNVMQLTIAAIRCDTSEETRMQPGRAFQTPPYAFHLNECTWQECSFRCGELQPHRRQPEDQRLAHNRITLGPW